MDVDLSQYRATIRCFIGKSIKKKKRVKPGFADTRGGSPDKLFHVSVFVFISLAVISVVRILLVMQDVEENRGPGQIFTMSSLDKPKLSSADMADISINVICCDSRVVGDILILRSKSRITKKTFCELLDRCRSFQIYIHSPSCCLHVKCTHGIIDFRED